MRLLEPIVNFIADSEWCGEFREELAIDSSFRGWMIASRGLMARLAGRLVLAGVGFGLIALMAYFILRGSD